eukprot:11305682-Ditylum_brightwellii.AAC.1
MPAASSAKLKFYCEMHEHNMTHNTKDCFELNRRAKCTKANPNQVDKRQMSYKDLNAFINAKVTAALKKAQKEKKEKKTKKVTINAFDKFRFLNVDSSSEEESNHEVNTLAATSNNDSDSDSDDSCVPSEDSKSDNK